MEQSNGQVFVYGSLRSGFQHPAYAYISRYFTLLTEAKVNGRLYDMGEYPAAMPSDATSFITGELYQINHPDEFDWAIAQLDDYEGLNTEQGETPLYRREQVTVHTAQGDTQAWIYWFNGDVSGKTVIESGDVLQYIQQKNKS
jgi:gamma-glutamylcyclotransferase (GGCT)/AIG2-like uncharacterized protein YtfP